MALLRNWITCSLMLSYCLGCGTDTTSEHAPGTSKPDHRLWEQRWNPDRDKRNITFFYDSLHLSESTPSYISWESNNWQERSNNLQPAHRYKSIRLDTNGVTLIDECDFFLSGKKWSQWPFEDGSEFPEELSVTYYYDLATYHKEMKWMAQKELNPPWFCILRVAPLDQQITIHQADSVLASWGIDRLRPK